jgi:hypothetical protein
MILNLGLQNAAEFLSDSAAIRFLRRSLLLHVEVHCFQSRTVMSQTRIWMVTGQRFSFIHHSGLNWHKWGIRKRSVSYLIFKGHCNHIKCFLNILGLARLWQGNYLFHCVVYRSSEGCQVPLQGLAHWKAHIKYCIIFRNSVREMSATDGSRTIY